jgi:hypothetical protein
MVRGIDVGGDPFRLRRLQAWYIEETMQEFHKTMLIVAASMPNAGGNDLQELVRKYRESLFPSGKTNQQLIEQYKEVLATQEGKVLEVRSLEK